MDAHLFLTAWQAVDYGHAMLLLIGVFIIMRSGGIGRFLSLMAGRTSPNTMPNSNGTAKAHAVEKALAKHEITCNDRHAKIDGKFAIVFAKLDALTSSVSEINGYLKGKREVKP